MILYYWSKILKKIRGAAIKNSIIDSTSTVESGSLVVGSAFGKHSFCGYNCQILNCEIGSYCSIAGGVIIGGGMHPTSWVSTSPAFYIGRDSIETKLSEHARDPVKKVIIGHDVWIGENALIKQGVKIGTGAVVGMGSVVTKDVKPYMIVAGNPAKVIRPRFSENIITRLLESKWWIRDESELKKLGKYIQDPELFLSKIDR